MKNKSPIGSLLALMILWIAGCESGTSAPYAGSGAPPDTSNDGYGTPTSPATDPYLGSQAGSAAPAASIAVALASSASFESYLTDGSGRALYMFANDVPGVSSSACTAACLDKWPVFDAKDISVGAGLVATDFTRFQRADGVWQTAFKGHPLYRFTMDTGASVTGDGAAGRWYVARDYLAFVATKADLTPQGAAMPAPYLTNRAGRTVYVFMNDTAGTATAAPVSACVDKCLDAWPTWNAPSTAGAMTLPSSMLATDFGQLERSIAGATVKQLTYRGFPLYFHTPDIAAGETTGHMSGAWRAIDPTAFPAAAAAAAAK
jgi:predicted lipoprotein with Yx(FWY)xxD motif